MDTFDALPVAGILTNTLKEKNITKPTPVQEVLIPEIYEGKNIIFQSETGTGKTFAFLLPLITKIIEEHETLLAQKVQPSPQPRILIIAPTHELCSQIKSQAEILCEPLKNTEYKIKPALFIGGSSITRQSELLKTKPLILIGGPARILELIHLKKLKTDKLTAIVLDEVDRLFSPELRDITTELLHSVPEAIQVAACSATIKDTHAAILEKETGKTFITQIMPPENVLAGNIKHWAFHAEKRDKIDLLRSILNAEKPAKAMIFSAETGQIANIVSKLQYKKINCAGLHAKTDKAARKKAIDDFRSGKCTVLVTSDLAARGLDIQGITHIIQMDVPDKGNKDFFIHRAGRTARAGNEGINIIIGDEYELRALSRMEKKLGITIVPKQMYGGKITEPKVF